MEGEVLQVHITSHEGRTVCRPVGELDAFTVGGFRDHLAELETTGGIVIDLSEVPFMDSAGLGALIGGIRRVRDGGGSVAVVCSRPAVLRLLHTTGFDRIVDVSSTLDEAVAGLPS
jgi:anti-sigma B factor antagonist